jgi:hypothetical protein
MGPSSLDQATDSQRGRPGMIGREWPVELGFILG